METISSSDILFISSEFKSYYVVWKPNAIPVLPPAHLEFKSYYVVWKRVWECIDGWSEQV